MALRGKFAKTIGDKVLKRLRDEIQIEFPVTNNIEFMKFMEKRGYDKISDPFWSV